MKKKGVLNDEIRPESERLSYALPDTAESSLLQRTAGRCVRRSISSESRAGLRPHSLTSRFTSFVHELLAGTARLIATCSFL